VSKRHRTPEDHLQEENNPLPEVLNRLLHYKVDPFREVNNLLREAVENILLLEGNNPEGQEKNLGGEEKNLGEEEKNLENLQMLAENNLLRIRLLLYNDPPCVRHNNHPYDNHIRL